jgi:hypothetical protein
MQLLIVHDIIEADKITTLWVCYVQVYADIQMIIIDDDDDDGWW